MEFAAEEPAPAEEIAPAAEKIAPAAEEVAPVAPVAVEEAPEAEETLALEEAAPQADDVLSAPRVPQIPPEDSAEKTATGSWSTAASRLCLPTQRWSPRRPPPSGKDSPHRKAFALGRLPFGGALVGSAFGVLVGGTAISGQMA